MPDVYIHYNGPTTSNDDKCDGPPGGTEVDVPDFPPSHPGVIVDKLILPRLVMTREQLSQRTGISVSDVNALISGALDVSEELRDKLRLAFKGGADLLYREQRVFDYYSVHKKYPPPTGPW